MRLLLTLCCFACCFEMTAQKLVSYYDADKRAYGYKDSANNMVIAPMYNFADNFAEGLGMVRLDGKYGFINNKNKPVIPITLYKAESFANGVAIVSDSVAYFFIDKTGKKKFPQTYLNANGFTEGMAAVMNKDSLWGFINSSGNLAIPYQYIIAGSFSEGLAFVRKQGHIWQAINQKNEVKFEKEAIRLWPYRKGCAAIQLKEKGKYNYGDEWSFLNKNGELLSNDRFEGVTYFEGSTSMVYNYDNDNRKLIYGVIDNTGKLIIPVTYTYLKKYSKGYLYSNETGMIPEWFGYIDSTFKAVIPANYKFKGTFGDSLFLVQEKSEYATKFNLLNSKGKALIPLSYQSYVFYDHKKNPILLFYTNYGSSVPGRTYGIKTGLIGNELLVPDMKYEVFVDDKGYSYKAIMDLSGKGLVDNSFKVIYHSSYRNFGADKDKFEKLKRGFPAPAYGKDSTWYFDKKLKKLTKLKYFVIDHDDFSDGLLKVSSNFLATEYGTDKTTKFGFLDSTFKLVIPLSLADVNNFREGRARIKKTKPDGYTGIYGFIDKTGKEIIKAQYEDATDFTNGYSIVKMEGKEDAISILDKTGKTKTMIPGVKYNHMLETTKEGLVFAESTGGKWGLWNILGQNIIPAIYDINKAVYSSVPWFDNNGLVALQKDGKTTYFDTTGKVIK